MNELEKYIDDIKNNPEYIKVWKDWAYGAIDFCYTTNRITISIYDCLIEKYDL